MPNAVTVAIPFHSVAKSVTGFAIEGTGESAKIEIKIEEIDDSREICSTKSSFKATYFKSLPHYLY